MASQHQNTSKRYSEGNSFGNKEGWNKGHFKEGRSRDSYERYSENSDKEYKMFCEEERRKEKVEFVRVKEIEADLFAMEKEYSLAHCVAEDMRMGSGIAVTFK